MLHLRSFGLALLTHLVLVLGSRLIFLERFSHFACRLVGQSVVVDGLLNLGFLGDFHAGIAERCVGTLFLRVEPEIHCAWLSLVVEAVGKFRHAALGIVLLLLLGERDFRPFGKGLDLAVLREPRRLLLIRGAALCLRL